VVALTELLIND